MKKISVVMKKISVVVAVLLLNSFLIAEAHTSFGFPVILEEKETSGPDSALFSDNDSIGALEKSPSAKKGGYTLMQLERKGFRFFYPHKEKSKVDGEHGSALIEAFKGAESSSDPYAFAPEKLDRSIYFSGVKTDDGNLDGLVLLKASGTKLSRKDGYFLGYVCNGNMALPLLSIFGSVGDDMSIGIDEGGVSYLAKHTAWKEDSYWPLFEEMKKVYGNRIADFRFVEEVISGEILMKPLQEAFDSFMSGPDSISDEAWVSREPYVRGRAGTTATTPTRKDDREKNIVPPEIPETVDIDGISEGVCGYPPPGGGDPPPDEDLIEVVKTETPTDEQWRLLVEAALRKQCPAYATIGKGLTYTNEPQGDFYDQFRFTGLVLSMAEYQILSRLGVNIEFLENYQFKNAVEYEAAVRNSSWPKMVKGPVRIIGFSDELMKDYAGETTVNGSPAYKFKAKKLRLKSIDSFEDVEYNGTWCRIYYVHASSENTAFFNANRKAILEANGHKHDPDKDVKVVSGVVILGFNPNSGQWEVAGYGEIDKNSGELDHSGEVTGSLLIN